MSDTRKETHMRIDIGIEPRNSEKSAGAGHAPAARRGARNGGANGAGNPPGRRGITRSADL
jgi:hypothetical protein